MRKNSAPESGIFNPRILFATALCSAGALLAMFSFASTPPSGTLTDASGPLGYMAGPFDVANPTPVILVDAGPECLNPAQPCDDYALTVMLPSGYHAAHPNAAVKVTLSWGDTGSGQSDYDLYIYKNPRADCTPADCTVTDGTQMADYQSAGGSNPEVATISPLADGTRQYTVVIVPYTPTNETTHVIVELLPGPAGGGGGPFGGPDPTMPGIPRYQNFYAPTGTSAQSGNGEFNIGFNPITKRIMAMNIGPIWRLTPGEVQVPSKPECCEALWEDKSANTTNTGLDPILWTDQKTGRTFASNSTAGANAVYAYTDAAAPFNDGDLWVEAGFSPPNGGADHQSIGSGPYPLVLGMPNPLVTALNQGEAVYYCSQDIVGPAACQRSDNLGASYGPGVLAYDGVTTACGGLHGHVHVAPNGTVWLPVNQCGGEQGGAVSTDNGTTWSEFIVTGSHSQGNGADPSVAIDSASTAYYCYVNNEPVAVGNPPEGHVRVKVSTDGGATWIRDFDLGASHGIVNAVHTEAVGGSAGRAACGFFGTNVAGDYQSLSFPGKWYSFIATTYDGGLTWTTVNATPNDPVQSMTGIWQQGGGAQDRNLLDFNEITIDDKGRVLYGYSDGCTSGPCIAGLAANDFNAYMRVARQFGGKPLFSQFDPAEPTAPKPPCLSGTRDSAASHLAWKIPDNGGSDITGYQILRGTTAGSETVLVNNTGDERNIYIDNTALASVPHYFYVVKAINGTGTGLQSNEVDLTVTATPPPENGCVLPGLTILIDPPNDALDMVAGHDVQHLWVAEPLAFAPNQVVFTLKMQSLATVPPNTRWPITFDVGAPAVNYTVRMTNVTTDGATTAPIFQVGPTGGPFVTAAAGSNFNADGTITIVVPVSSIGNPTAGEALTSFLTRITVATTLTPDNMPDSLTPTGGYTIIGNQACAPTPTPTPPPFVSISGTLLYCSNPVPGPVPNVTLTLTGDASNSTVSDGSGNYQLSPLATGGNYTVTPTKAALTPGSAGINTVDAVAVQRHFLNFEPLPPGCRLTAADVNADTSVNTTDVIAIQRFFLSRSTGLANVGKYLFTPASRTYPGLVSNQTGQDYDTLIFGDVATGFVERPAGLSQDAPEFAATVAAVALPDVAVDQSKRNFIAAVKTSAIDAKNKLVGFQGDFTFDERVVTFQSEPVRKAGLTAGNWNVSGNVLPGAGPIRTLRISAYSNDFMPLSGEGTLFELRMTGVSKPAQGMPLTWAAPPDQFIFIDADLNTQPPGNAAPGSVTTSGKRR